MQKQNNGAKDKLLLIPGQVVCADAGHNILTNHAVEITGNKITSIKKITEFDLTSFQGEIIRAEGLTLIPGFVQTHIHLCQVLFRGLADDLQLLDWLQTRIFPFEKAHNKNSLRMSARLGINELLSSGTTTLLDMGTINHQEVIFDELATSGMRAIAGKCMMDVNDLYPEFKAETEDELKNTYELAKNYHNYSDGKIKYGFAPRFVLSCTEGLLKETKAMMNDFPGSIYHTHSSENKNEVAEVRRLHNKENIEYFNSIDVLGDHTFLAHCVHTNENEISLLKQTGTRVAHCPSANLKLGSGIANIPGYLNEGISVSLGADGAPCNNSLSAFMEMRLAALLQKPFHGATSMDAEKVFRMATIEGAKALHLDNEIGSIEEGKKADLVLLNLNDPVLPLSSLGNKVYSSIVYSATKENINSVMLDGEWVVKNGNSLLFDREKLLKDSKIELDKLLQRANV